MLFATSDSDAAKKPRLRLMARRSSSVKPVGDFQSAISACIEISVGIQWLLHPERYFSHAQRYLSGRSWLTSARQLIIALSSTRTRAAPRAMAPSPGGAGPTISAGEGCVRMSVEGGSTGSLQSRTEDMGDSSMTMYAFVYWQASQVG